MKSPNNIIILLAIILLHLFTCYNSLIKAQVFEDKNIYWLSSDTIYMNDYHYITTPFIVDNKEFSLLYTYRNNNALDFTLKDFEKFQIIYQNDTLNTFITFADTFCFDSSNVKIIQNFKYQEIDNPEGLICTKITQKKSQYYILHGCFDQCNGSACLFRSILVLNLCDDILQPYYLGIWTKEINMSEKFVYIKNNVLNMDIKYQNHKINIMFSNPIKINSDLCNNVLHNLFYCLD